MNKHIETTERGITISKSLAWTLLVGLVSGGFWVGSSLTAVQSKVDQLSTQLSDLREDRARTLSDQSKAFASTADRLLSLERREATNTAQTAELTRVLNRIDTRLIGIEDRLRVQETTR